MKAVRLAMACAAVVVCAAATGADESAKVYAGWKALAADAKVSPNNPARESVGQPVLYCDRVGTPQDVGRA